MPDLRRRWLWRLLAGVGLLLVAGAGVYWFYEPGWRYPVSGVDVSHHQGNIDWNALAADGTDFAYIKATAGEDWTDTKFVENWRESGDAGILRGAYHFYTLCTSGAEQAAHLIATVPNEERMLPPAVDLEFGGNCSTRPSVDSFRAELDIFLDQIRTEYQRTPVIYTDGTFYGHYLANDPPDVIWWIMSPIVDPLRQPQWTFWQHFPGHRDGVEGRFDRNAFKSDISTLQSLTTRVRP